MALILRLWQEIARAGLRLHGVFPSMSLQPNVLWIVTTQWRAQAFRFAGDPNARTPHLDALAAESVNYTQAVTPHPFGPFARAALLTGVPSPENGVRHYHDPLPLGSRTVAHAFSRRGYFTGFFGKWHLASRDPNAPLVGEVHARTRVPPEARGGFDHWEGFEGGFLVNNPFLHGTSIPEPTAFPGYQSDVLCERASCWLARPQPWFCVASLEPPHPPYTAPSSGVVPQPPSEIVLRPNVPAGHVGDQARQELAGYYAHIEATDRAIGRLVAHVDADNTTVVFTSVHGDMHGSHGLFRKGWPHEESVRVPLLVRRPGTAARNDGSAVSLLELGGMSLAWIDGREFPATRAGSSISMPSIVRLPLQCDCEWRGIRTAHRKLVLNPDGSTWLYFDLEEDPWEQQNLASDPSRVAEIAELHARI